MKFPASWRKCHSWDHIVRGEEIMKTTSLKGSPKDFFSQLLFDDRKLHSNGVLSSIGRGFFASFLFSGITNLRFRKAWVLQIAGWGFVASISWELLPWMDKPQASASS